MPDTHTLLRPRAGSPLPPAPQAAASWQQTISHGDIVSFHFPVEDGDGGPGKARPCLVLDVVAIAGTRLITLAYGTSSPKPTSRAYVIPCDWRDDWRAAGLLRPTHFRGVRRVSVTADHPGFACNRAGTPVIGRLEGRPFERMNAVRGRLHAEADIAAERRRERRASSRRAPVTRPVVEHRRARPIRLLTLTPISAAKGPNQ